MESRLSLTQSTTVYMLFPEYLEPFRKEARILFFKKKVLEIIFSGPTYQIRVDDVYPNKLKNREFTDAESTRFDSDSSTCSGMTWVFVQLDQERRVKDIFCQCDKCQEEGACIHMALALIAIADDGTLPLHIEFEKSPFYTAFSPLSHKGLSHQVKKGKGKLDIGNSVSLLGKEAWINAIYKELLPKDETEETSIKFSDLSEEEIENWRKGIFSDRLKFELSPYADIAKKLFLLSKKEPPSYTVQENTLEIHWKECQVKLPLLSEKNLNTLLDSLPPKEQHQTSSPMEG